MTIFGRLWSKVGVAFAVVAFAVISAAIVLVLSAGPQDPNDPNFPIADTNGDYRVTIIDLSYTLFHWQTSDDTADFNDDGVVNIADLSYLLAQWGRVDTPPVNCSSPVTINPPATNFAQTVASASPGTCFYLTNGVYDFLGVRPKDNMIFEGQSVEGVIVDGSNQASQVAAHPVNCHIDTVQCDVRHVFVGAVSGVTIRNMQFRNFQWRNPSGNIWQELTPILGKNTVFDHDDEAARHRANNWLIENVWSHGNVASGLHVGNNFTVRGSKFYGNGITGISGDRFRGGLIENNELYNNAADQAGGQFINGGGMKFTWADDNVADHFIIRDNDVHDNESVGIWCDLDCNNVLIENNTVYDNFNTSSGLGVSGIFYELSRNGIIRGNTVTNSSQDLWGGSPCIKLASAQDMVVENNTTNDCYGSIVVKAEKRPLSGETFLQKPEIWSQIVSRFSARITVRNNTINTSRGAGAILAPGAQDATQYSTINFENNNYNGSNTSTMIFWWGLQKLNYQEWLAMGQQ